MLNLTISVSQMTRNSQTNGTICWVDTDFPFHPMVSIGDDAEKMRPRVLIEVSGGVAEVTYTRPGIGSPEVELLDWDNLTDEGNDPADYFLPGWVFDYAAEQNRGSYVNLAKYATRV